MPATPEQLLALLEAPHWKQPGSTTRRPEGPTARRTEGQAAVNLTVVDHIAEGRDALARAAKLAKEGTTLAEREARALREAQAMKSEAIMGTHYRVRQMSCPACGCVTLLPKNGRAFCINRHCARGGMQRRWSFRELAFIGPGQPMEVRRTETKAPPKDARPLRWLVKFFTETGLPISESTLRRIVSTHQLPHWYNPMNYRAHLYSLSDVATAHAQHLAHTKRGECAKPSGRPPCTGLADMFFARTQNQQVVEAAKKLCSVCPLRQVCMDTAMDHPDYQQHGIFGGLTAHERKQLKRGESR
ncbi:WhiB family transcriptional regulator [Streptomyces sp. 030-HV]|uniref:WhiB family transcriptional regulator n=1 Tax=Streptomyces sp. 030-HV TaxID=2789262 RepID=UPI00397F34E8